MSESALPPHAVAVVGLAGRFPGARTLDEFWEIIAGGVECLETFSDADLEAAGVPPALQRDPMFVRKGTVLEEADHFDAGFFGLTPREAEILDPQHRIFLECAWEALEHAGYAPGDSERVVGVYAGASMNTYLFTHILSNPAIVEAAGGYQLMLGNDKDFLCTRVSYKLGLRGPSMSVQTACSTSLVAVEVACRALGSGECDIALAGGVSASFPQRAGYLHQDGMIFSPDGHCRPFDEAAAGTRAGSGAGVVVLKRLADAIADRDTIHAVIRGAAINNDGAGKAGFTAPSIDGQAAAIAAAHARAGVAARSIGFVEAHGTATPLGDPIEIAALTQVFRQSTQDRGFCRIGSLKANLGHLDAAAGVAGLIKAVLALQHREFPPLVNFRAPNRQLGLERGPFVASAERAVWPEGAAPRRAGVSSFGIGGTNAHVVLEEAPAVVPVAHGSTEQRTEQLLVLSAKTPTALDRASADLASHLERHPDVALSDVAWTLQVGRKSFPHRRMVAAEDAAQAARALRRPDMPPVLTAQHEGRARPVAFLFSGQGSQHAGMGEALYHAEPAYREAIDVCAAELTRHLGCDLRDILFGTPADARMDQTRFTQPALFCTEYALATLWMRWGVRPASMLGHSIGEYVAAHLSGVLSLSDALAVVAARGSLMQALPAGGMAAVAYSAAELQLELGQDVEIAAENAPGLCTISGPVEAVEAAVRRLEARGISCRTLRTSHAFHSAMMEEALAPFRAVLESVSLSPPRIPYVSNLTGDWITAEQAISPAYYAEHLRRTVRFEAGLRTLATDPSLFLLEVGPGDTLTGLARSTFGTDGAPLMASSLPNPRRSEKARRALLETAGRLWLSGAALDWSALHEGDAPRRVPLPTYPFERTRHAVAPKPPAAVNEGPTAAPAGPASPRFFAPSWTRDESFAGAEPRLGGVWLVLGDKSALAWSLMRKLAGAGALPVLVEAGGDYAQASDTAFHVRPGAAADFEALLGAVERLHGRVSGAIVLWDVAGSAHPLPTPAYAGLVALTSCLPVWDEVMPGRVIVVTAGAQSVLDEPIARPDASLLFGPALVLPTEVPGVTIRSVDLEPDAITGADAGALLAEAACDDDAVFSAWRRGRRWVRRYQAIELPDPQPAALPVREGGVYLITGGLGGIGLALASWLAARVRARLLLTGRRPVPLRGDGTGPGDGRTRAVIDAVRQIEAAGGEVIIAQADAADRVAMARAIEKARLSWGRIDGVIHAAGVPGSGHVAARQDEDEIRSVIAPKAGGLSVLVDLLGSVRLDFVALMSSISSVTGGPGTASYTAANAWLDAFVESGNLPAEWRRVFAVNWAAWREVGMAADLEVPEALRAEREATLRAGIGTAAGVDAFRRILASGRPRVVVTAEALDVAAQRPRFPTVSPSAGGGSGCDEPGADLAGSSLPAGETGGTQTEQRLASIWSELIGIRNIGPDHDFFELGGHSLLATRVLARINVLFGVRLALRDVFRAPTLRLLAGRIDEVMAECLASARETEDGREEILI